MTKWLVTSMLVAAACGGGSDVPNVDAPDVPTTCPAQPATPLAPGTHRVYLNFEGVTLTKCAGALADARANCTDLIKQDPSVIPPYMDGNVDRQTRIDFIVGKVQGALAPYSVDVVTARPASGDYMMVVLGGNNLQLGFSNITGVATQQCALANPNLVSLEFDFGLLGYPQASGILSDLAMMFGLGVTPDLGDCANRTDNPPGDTLCTFGTMATTAAQRNCGHTPTQNEPELLSAALGCR